MRITRKGWPRARRRLNVLQLACTTVLVAALGAAHGIDQNGWW